MATEIRYGLLLDGQDVTRHVRSVHWTDRLDAPFQQITVQFQGDALREFADPNFNDAARRLAARLELLVWGESHTYLVEGPTGEAHRAGSHVGVWGRDPSAIMDRPHCTPMTFVVEQDVRAAVLANSIVNSQFKANGLSWEIEDWPIYAEGFAVLRETPLGVLQRIVEPVSAFIHYDHELGKVRVFHWPYDLAAETIASTITDKGDVLKFSDRTIPSPGYNSIHVTGWGYGEGDVEIETSEVEGHPDQLWVDVYTEPVDKLSLVHMASTDGRWQTVGEGCGKQLTYEPEDEELWDFRGTQLRARYPIYPASSPSVVWLSNQEPTLLYGAGSRLVELSSPTENEQYLSLAKARYATRRNRYKLLGLTEPYVKIWAYYED